MTMAMIGKCRAGSAIAAALVREYEMRQELLLHYYTSHVRNSLGENATMSLLLKCLLKFALEGTGVISLIAGSQLLGQSMILLGTQKDQSKT